MCGGGASVDDVGQKEWEARRCWRRTHHISHITKGHCSRLGSLPRGQNRTAVRTTLALAQSFRTPSGRGLFHGTAWQSLVAIESFIVIREKLKIRVWVGVVCARTQGGLASLYSPGSALGRLHCGRVYTLSCLLCGFQRARRSGWRCRGDQ